MSLTNLQRQILPQRLTIRQTDDRSQPVLSGLAAPYFRADRPGSQFELGRGAVERIEPGAFRGLVESRDEVLMLDAHRVDRPLARRSADTLRLSEGPDGLRFEFDVPNTTLGNDVLENVRNGNLAGVSIGFEAPPGSFRWSEEAGRHIRTLTGGIRVREISTIAAPAFKDTSIAERGEQLWLELVRWRCNQLRGITDGR